MLTHVVGLDVVAAERLYLVDDLVRRVATVLGTPSGDPMTRRDDGFARKPHRPVGRHRRVPGDDEDPTLHGHRSALRLNVIRRIPIRSGGL